MLQSKLFWVGFWTKAIWTLLRKRRKFVQQTTQTDCGVASALTLLNFMALPSDPVHAVETMDSDRTGTSLEALRLYFEDHYALKATAFAVPPAQVRSFKGQIILHMRQMHYVVLLQATKAGALVFDPSLGPVYYPSADFAALYSGHLLQIKPAPKRQGVSNVPAKQQPMPHPPREAAKKRLEPLGLFIIGMATRLLECALLLSVVAVLFLVLNRASFPSLLQAFGIITVAGIALMLARHIRFDGEDSWVRARQSRLWRSILRTSMRGRDLHGFRGRAEREVSTSVRRSLGVTLQQRSEVPATLGSFAVMPLILCLLSPLLGVAHLVYYLTVLAVTHLDGIKVCRSSVRGKYGRYSKLTQGRALINVATASELIGELAKWSVIGVAGYTVLIGVLPPVALMFWILTAMQIVPLDFKRAVLLTPMNGAKTPVSGLTGTEVPLRQQRIIGPVDLAVTREPDLILIDGISPLTMTLQQPDLTVREQRLIMADVVAHTLRNLPQEHQIDVGPIRIFGPGQDANQAEYEYLMIARESRSKIKDLPALRARGKTEDGGMPDRVLRNLISCEPGDFPVFWDLRSTLALSDLQARAEIAGCAKVGHLTMGRLTVIERMQG